MIILFMTPFHYLASKQGESVLLLAYTKKKNMEDLLIKLKHYLSVNIGKEKKNACVYARKNQLRNKQIENNM